MSLKLAIQLLDESVITQNEFLSIVREYESSRLSEISVALRQNLVTPSQAWKVLNLQRADGSASFCEIASGIGLLGKSDCRQIRNFQDASRRSIQKILVDLQICTDRQVEILDRTLRLCEGRLCQGQSAVKPPKPKFSRMPRMASQSSSASSI